jgi:hypothetical protein
MLAFNHPISIYLRGPIGRDRRLNSAMAKLLDLDTDKQWRIESVTWEPPGATASLTLIASSR